MPGFRSVKSIVDAYEAGRSQYCTIRKLVTATTGAGYWYDFAMASGMPRAIYYASSPLVAATLARSTHGGIDHGGAVAPRTKHLHRLLMWPTVAGGATTRCILLDYLLYYPFIDEGIVGEEQALENPVTLPRHVTGEGVQVIPVVVAPHGTSFSQYAIRYTNSDGVADRVSQTVRMQQNGTANGVLLSSASASVQCYSPWIPLQFGDKGVRSVEGVTILTTGDVGLFTLVLVKPIADFILRSIDAPTEVDFAIHRPSLPVIADDAFLGMIALCGANLSGGAFYGEANFIWSE